jgi:hypothetical protein
VESGVRYPNLFEVSPKAIVADAAKRFRLVEDVGRQDQDALIQSISRSVDKVSKVPRLRLYES